MNLDFHRQDSEGKLYLNTGKVNRRFWDKDGINWEIRLTRNIPLAIDVKSAAANMAVTIPDGVAARIHVDTSLSTFDVDESRFPKQGDYYISDDFDATRNRIYLEIDCDVGRVQVK